MSRLNDLLATICPQGVPFETLASVGRWYGGGTPSKAKPENWANGTIPWISPKDMGPRIVDKSMDAITEAALLGSAAKLVPANSVAVVVRSSILERTLPTALVPVSVALNQDMKAVVPREDILPAYLAQVLSSSGPKILRTARKIGGSVASIDSPKLLGFRIPVPPLAVQREIVRILDQFSHLEAELEAELKAELEARTLQYEHIRDGLVLDSGGRMQTLGEIGTFMRGRRFTKADVVERGVPSIHYGEIYTHYRVSATSAVREVREEMSPRLRFARPNDVVFAGVGETVEDVGKAVAWLGDHPVAVHDDTFAFTSDANPKYIAYAVQTADFQAQKVNHVARGKVKRLSSSGLAQVSIPVPEAGEQSRIVDLLDNLNALVSDLSIGLPAELAARRKQYEYYRASLLSFKEAS